MLTIRWTCRFCVAVLLLSVVSVSSGEQASLGIATLRPGVKSGFSNGGWNFDAYPELKPLNAGKAIVVADLKGPGVIRMFHTTRHWPADVAARGIVLEITFDKAAMPAVEVPLADFFGDGCNGGGMDFSSEFIECPPGSYNCYFPMPFKTHAKVVLRNDTNRNVTNYSFVEWEPLKEWKKDLGYFHATFQRKCFQLTPKSDETFFEVEGTGQVVGRQFSIVTDEPFFQNFNFVMEGNNSIDIDGQPRRFDYLGSEDSFSFSWGFQRPFAGLRSGMTLVQPKGPAKVSMYRFHDAEPIRFDQSLRWRIDWTKERHILGSREWAAALKRGGCWVDYATVYYWYQNSPGGYVHQKLPSVADRRKLMMRPQEKQ
jgi:D-arabinan exo alpha-(1,3)/(1,5)-arabinofuranosidase (non-reducing end)